MPQHCGCHINVRSSSHSVPVKSTLRLHELEADSVFPVKDNQPLLLANLHTCFLTRTDTHDGQTSQQVVYLITSLTPE